MTNGFIISTIFEIIAGAFIIWGVFNESKLVDFEDKIVEIAKSCVHKIVLFRRRKISAARCRRCVEASRRAAF